jgi:ROS/MUCR transcriptional regulator protein
LRIKITTEAVVASIISGNIVIPTIGHNTDMRISRLVGRLHTEFLPLQTPDAIIAQAGKVKDVTVALRRIAANSPERLGAILGILSEMADVGVIRDMDDAHEEVVRIENKLPHDVIEDARVADTVKPTASPRKSYPLKPRAAPGVMYRNSAASPPPDAVQMQVVAQMPDQPATPVERSSGTGHGRGATSARANDDIQPGMSLELPWKPRQWVAKPDRPTLPVQNSVREDRLTCLHCGEGFTMLKRHIENKHRQTPEAYRAYWGLPANYPMACEAYSEMKKAEAEVSRFGSYDRRKRRQKKDLPARGTNGVWR